MAHHHRHLGLQARNIHSHAWLVGLLGLIAGLALLIYVPTLGAIANSLVLFAAFHIIGAVVLLVSLYGLAFRGIGRRALGPWGRIRPATGGAFDFGWGPEWMNGLAVGALATFAAAIAVQVSAPGWWPLAITATLLAAALFVGNTIMRSFRSADFVVLPMVDLLQSDQDLVLDAGCGAGRTTIALRRILRKGRVVAVDRFDADYIEDGGRELLDRNLRLAGLADRVRVETADLTALPLSSASMDAAVSTNVFDHLGHKKQQALCEVFRVLKPGGRFLMSVWVPGLAMFAVANLLSLFLTSRAEWRAMARSAGFEIVDEGVFNYAWFTVLKKPLPATNSAPA